MIEQIIPLFFAILGLSFLIFVHELGHLIAAIRVNMDVESFGIGFGRPIFSFVYKGIRFNICWIPFGGYVKIVGMDGTSVSKNPLKKTFFTASPYQRLQVAVAGPLANIFFSLLLFSLVWVSGGREKMFSSVTDRIGWVDPTSELYVHGLRPGDRVVSYSGREIHSSQDHIQAAMTGGDEISVTFETMGTYSTPPKRVICAITPYQIPKAPQGLLTTGVLSSASFLIWNPRDGESLNGRDLSMPEALGSGIQPNDRIVWVDNVPIFSLEQLQEVLNDAAVFVTVERRGEEALGLRQLRIPRVSLMDLKISSEMQGELSDWQYMASLNHIPMTHIWFIPYNISSDGTVENPISYIDTYTKKPKYQIDTLLPGDRIVAVAGQKVLHASEILQKLHDKKALIIVERDTVPLQKIENLENTEAAFIRPYSSEALYQIVSSIGTQNKERSFGSLTLLQPFSVTEKDAFIRHVQEVYNKVHNDQLIEKSDTPSLKVPKYVLGLFGVSDREVLYNPTPIDLMITSVQDIGNTLKALVSGTLSPKWMAGPVGIIDSIQTQVRIGGTQEVLFWLAILSINLALLNLLPLPALDGGYIFLSIFEMITGIKPAIATLEKILLPFIFLLIGLFVYLTYNDILRLVMRYLGTG